MKQTTISDVPAKVRFPDLPDFAFVRADVLFDEGLLPFSKATLWRLVKAQKFPAPAKISGNITAWEVGAVRRWLCALAKEAAE